MNRVSMCNIAFAAFGILLSASVHAAKDVGLILIDGNGCPQDVVPETDACPDDVKGPGRICRHKASKASDLNANKLRWKYEGNASRDQFTIEFKQESPFGDCGVVITSKGGQPKTDHCKISSDTADGAEYPYSVIVEGHETCPLDPHVYILK